LVRYLSFASGLINTAGDYELFTLERRLREQKVECEALESAKKLCISFTTRFFPIYGATANSFGAFLGKPLREIDFYVGIYDGLYADVQYGRCRAQARQAADSACIRKELTRIIADTSEVPELSQHGREILQALRLREFEPGIIAPTTTDGRTLRLIQMLDDLRAAEKATSDKQCEELGGELSFFCADGLRKALQAQKRSRYRDFRTALDGETDEQRFDALVDDFDAEIFRLLRPIVYRQWRVETGTSLARYFTRGFAKVGIYVIAKDEEHYRRGWQFDPSTVPDHRAEGNIGKHHLFHLFPYSIDGWESNLRATWSPSFVVRPGWELGLGPSIIMRDPGITRFRDDRLDVLTSARVRTPTVGPSFLHVGLQAAWDCYGINCDDNSIAQIGLTYLSRRLVFGRSMTFRNVQGTRAFRDPKWVFGVNDVAGVAHFLVPQN
jgi:hypothetical protein